ncbi:cob(I)yrinic acid a,c-diamide adenosyltransferase [Acidocella sp. MX-AZ02]|uniref:cob(I)yrinic acid a,c-diamide adenosyltransferase n=1 Tax=Acidocella sp. MX-AZ02 TaxID=1214225 RepID=UPI00028D5A1B|nr:cob(I)yrinic acid a,c-diamide adenosyltransferase [Acidocella sp. MX-AZ02]EKN01124.1 ATP--cobalamin adenosyltransferase [Acidocella sp. MX-AZ02]
MVKLDKIYTRGGDQGETSLGNGARVAKSSARIAALGEVDEANAAIGLARLEGAGPIDAILARIQNDLFDLGADLCTPIREDEAPGAALRIVPAQVAWLEARIDAVTAELAPLTSFILPAGSAGAARLHFARTVARRAERAVVALLEIPDEPVNRLVLAYLNRLSDLLFVLARAANGIGGADTLWVPAASRHG